MAPNYQKKWRRKTICARHHQVITSRGALKKGITHLCRWRETQRFSWSDDLSISLGGAQILIKKKSAFHHRHRHRRDPWGRARAPFNWIKHTQAQHALLATSLTQHGSFLVKHNPFLSARRPRGLRCWLGWKWIRTRGFHLQCELLGECPQRSKLYILNESLGLRQKMLCPCFLE